MDILAFCEDHPDWIQFTNAYVQMKKFPGSYLTFLDSAPLDLLGRGDCLVVMGHGNPTSIGKYVNAEELAQMLVNLGLRNNGATIILQTCSSADRTETRIPILYKLKMALMNLERETVLVQGAKAPSITGWKHTTTRVVPLSQLPRAGVMQGVSQFQNKDQIESAEKYIKSKLRPHLDSRGLTEIARHVYPLTTNFFSDFAARLEPFTIGDGIVTV